MKTISVILCTILVAVSLTGCMGNNNATTGSTPVPSLPTAGTTTPGTSGTDSAGVLEKIWGLYADQDRFAVYGGAMSHAVNDAPGDLDLGDTEELTTKYLLPEAQLAGIRDGASLVHMMNGNIFTAAAIGLSDGVDAQALASAWRDTIRQNRWICGQPDKLVMYRIGDQILMAFGSADAMQVWEAKTAEAFPDAHELYNEAVIS